MGGCLLAFGTARTGWGGVRRCSTSVAGYHVKPCCLGQLTTPERNSQDTDRQQEPRGDNGCTRSREVRGDDAEHDCDCEEQQRELWFPQGCSFRCVPIILSWAAYPLVHVGQIEPPRSVWRAALVADQFTRPGRVEDSSGATASMVSCVGGCQPYRHDSPTSHCSASSSLNRQVSFGAFRW